MTINSLPFLAFFSAFLIVYYSLRSAKAQNISLAIASLFFYCYANASMLPIMIGATVVYYCFGIAIERGNKYVGPWLIYGVGVGLLAVFKYFNFFIDSFTGLFLFFADEALLIPHIHLLLAVGISFYTFRLMSYALDVRSGKIAATHDLVALFTYVSYFPSVLSGPIERFGNFNDQMVRYRKIDFCLMQEGFRQIVWGMFKKMVIADTISMIVAKAWEGQCDIWPPMLLIAAVLYSFQIYCDFSGYSDMAIGVSKIMGIRLMPNFAYPYLSRSIQEFWRRWHISLTTWFTDYVYLPLGGSRCKMSKHCMNLFIVFVLSGLWHGDNMTFVYWGAYNGVILILLVVFGAYKYKGHIEVMTRKTFLQIIITFILATFGWMIFRAPSIEMFKVYCTSIVDTMAWTNNIGSIIAYGPRLALSLCVLIVCEWIYRKDEFPFQKKELHPFVLALFFWCVISQRGGTIDFIYFNF